ncbi:MAG: AAA family ATPase [Alphaproteobacteria bacterium]|nr:AAA family ATPase [Alphaproteobacteria bacterium]
MSDNRRISLPKSPDADIEVVFPTDDVQADRVHLLGTTEIHAINAAIVAGRPLLVRGEPGTGKSQLARAAARQLGRAFVHHVVDSRSESRDLLWTFDAVRRLADAQLAGSLEEDAEKTRADLAVENYLEPGPLWWAFHWESAAALAERVKAPVPAQRDGGDWKLGCVFLLDEIDKAESELPNGLLEALGAREFTPFGRSKPVRAEGTPPLVVITTNEERALPDAFLRRCLVLRLELPKDQKELVDHLIHRGKAHFPSAPDTILRKAAEMLFADRKAAIGANIFPRPGQAEYLDLLRAVLGLADDEKEWEAMLDIVAPYTLRKHVGTGRSD